MEAKQVGAIYADVKALETSDPNGAFEAVLSTGIVDRDGEIVVAGAFNPLPKSIPIHVNHEFMDVSKVVGRGEPFYDGDVLKVKGVFASTPDAQMVRTLVSEGMVQTMSVGFHRPTRDTKDGVPRVVSANLIEASFVSIPANAEALVTMAKALDTDLLMPMLKAMSATLEQLVAQSLPTASEVKAPEDTSAEESAVVASAASPSADVDEENELLALRARALGFTTL